MLTRQAGILKVELAVASKRSRYSAEAGFPARHVAVLRCNS